VNQPIVYATAVIVAGFLPIYALTGPSANCFDRWRIRDLRVGRFARYTVSHPCAVWGLRRGVRADQSRVRSMIDTRAVSINASRTARRRSSPPSCSLPPVAIAFTRGGVHAGSTKARCGFARPCRTPLLRGIVEDRTTGARHSAELSRGRPSWRRSTDATMPELPTADSSTRSSLSG
jgi:hypothetical protein